MSSQAMGGIRALRRRGGRSPSTSKSQEQAVVECLQPERFESSGLANCHLNVSTPTGNSPATFVEPAGDSRVLPTPPPLNFGDTVLGVYPPDNDVRQSFVIDFDVRLGGVRVTVDDFCDHEESAP
ncbi:hypothetical protein [Streptosporangium sp. OZ121]|uniref:hypothetical protein n=1 Tax=Streptosporangium sp. OZ121 TaxID=3444183 RepID=UPI003F794ACB